MDTSEWLVTASNHLMVLVSNISLSMFKYSLKSGGFLWFTVPLFRWGYMRLVFQDYKPICKLMVRPLQLLRYLFLVFPVYGFVFCFPQGFWFVFFILVR